MDIFQFINSKDIAAHLKSIDYSFTAPQAAFLLYYCQTATLDEKLAAWQEVIDTLPDCSMAARPNMVEIPSFHGFLRDYMALQRKKLAMFYDSTNAVYTYETYEDLSFLKCKRKRYEWFDSQLFFADFAACLRSIKKSMQINQPKRCGSRDMTCTGRRKRRIKNCMWR